MGEPNAPATAIVPGGGPRNRPAAALTRRLASERLRAVIDDPIHGDRIRTRYPEIAERPGNDGMIALDGLVDTCWRLHQQAATAWTFEVDLRSYKEDG